MSFGDWLVLTLIVFLLIGSVLLWHKTRKKEKENAKEGETNSFCSGSCGFSCQGCPKKQGTNFGMPLSNEAEHREGKRKNGNGLFS